MTRRIELNNTRNFGIIAHVDAGKTTLTERILYLTGAIHRSGEVHTGNTTTDSDDLEKQKGITINAATVTCHWQDHELRLIDTPGHVDFAADVEMSLRILDGAVIVLDAVAGVEPQTEAVWFQAARYKLPCLCFVNKLDRAGASFERSVASMREHLGCEPAIITLPLGEESAHQGIIDVIEERAYFFQDSDMQYETEPIPEALRPLAKQARERLIEQAADLDDAIAESYLNGATITSETLYAVLKAATLEGRLVPTLCGSAYKNRGVQQLLDAVIRYLPSPAERPPIIDESGNTRSPRNEEPLASLVFKVMQDDYGLLALCRLYSGTLQKGSVVFCSRTGRTFRVGRMVSVFADRRAEVHSACAGDIVGLVGSKLAVGDTLSSPDAPVTLVKPVLPHAVVRLALEPKTRGDHEQLSLGLEKLLAADPSLTIETDPETSQTLLCGLGELHLEVATTRLENQFGVKTTRGAPSVAYREALRKEVTHEYKLKKQSGGPGQFAKVTLRVTPASAGSGFTFESAVRAGAVPQEYIPAVRAGAEEALCAGPLGGYPLSDVHITLVDGEAHSQDSNELAFRRASKECVAQACAQADPCLLEPVMRVTTICPESYIGNAMGDLNARRGRITALNERGAQRVVQAEVPLATLFGYAGQLRSLTSGRGTFTMEFGSYQAVPDSLTNDRKR